MGDPRAWFPLFCGKRRPRSVVPEIQAALLGGRWEAPVSRELSAPYFDFPHVRTDVPLTQSDLAQLCFTRRSF